MKAELYINKSVMSYIPHMDYLLPLRNIVCQQHDKQKIIRKLAGILSMFTMKHDMINIWNIVFEIDENVFAFKCIMDILF